MIDQVVSITQDPRQVDLDIDLARCGISTHCRWTVKRKSDLLRILRQQPWAIDLICRRFLLTADEIVSWRVAVDKLGEAGLMENRVPDRRAA